MVFTSVVGAHAAPVTLYPRTSGGRRRHVKHASASRPGKPAETAPYYMVTLIDPSGKNTLLKVEADLSILDAAEEAEIELPFSCRAGACSSCAAQIIAGEVNQRDQSFLSEEHIEKGFILTCVAKPTRDCTILTEQEDALFD